MDYFFAKIGAATCCFGGVTSAVALIVSVVSWLLIPRWRTFRNYVFTNIVITFNAIFIIPWFLLIQELAHFDKGFWILECSMTFFSFSSYNWLLVLAFLFYTDLVKVFTSNVTRKFLKSNLFAWVLPFLFTAGKVTLKLYNIDITKENSAEIFKRDYIFLTAEIAEYGISIVLLCINLAVYIRVVYSLVSNTNISCSKVRDQKIQVATLAFLMSGSLLMVSTAMTITMLVDPTRTYIFYPLGLVVQGVQISVINILFLMSKSNREAWSQYLGKRRKVYELADISGCKIKSSGTSSTVEITA